MFNVSNFLFSVKVLYLLSAKSMPEAVKEEHKERLERGETVSTTEVKESIKQQKKTVPAHVPDDNLPPQEEMEGMLDDESSLDSPDPDIGQSGEVLPPPAIPADIDSAPVYFDRINRALIVLGEARADLVSRGYKTIPERLELLKIEIEQIKDDLRLGLSENPEQVVSASDEKPLLPEKEPEEAEAVHNWM